jgi:hypothetical protein
MRIHEILAIDRKTGEIADLLMRRIASAFTRHGDLKGLLGLGPAGDVAPYREPPVISPADDDPPAPISPTRSRSPVPGRHHAEQPAMAHVNNTPQLYAKPIDLASRRR